MTRYDSPEFQPEIPAVVHARRSGTGPPLVQQVNRWIACPWLTPMQLRPSAQTQVKHSKVVYAFTGALPALP